MGGGYSGYGDVSRTNFIKLFQNKMASAFPAVAVMDRLILAPQGIHEAFDKVRGFSWFLRPLDLNGVSLVDFRDAEPIREAIRQVGLRLKAEVIKLNKRHMLIRKIPNPDLSDLSELLKIDKEYLEEIQLGFSKAVLVPKVVSGPAPLEKESIVILEIQNQSANPLERVQVLVRGPSGVLVGTVAPSLDFPGGNEGTRRIQFSVTPKTAPYCPLEVQFGLSETDGTDPAFPIPVVLDVY